jgi:hypothetical protein
MGESDIALSIDWLLEGYYCATSVCRIECIDRGIRYGTGFLFCDEWIITNNHVIENIDQVFEKN